MWGVSVCECAYVNVSVSMCVCVHECMCVLGLSKEGRKLADLAFIFTSGS